MANVFIIHGYKGHSQENWFPWLKQELEQLGHIVTVPDFPDPGYPELSRWINSFQQYKSLINEDNILVGHSLGGAFLLSWLEQNKARAAYFVASVSGQIGHPVDSEISTFTHKIFDWEKIKSNSNICYIFHSDNDPYIPLKQAKELAENLNSELLIIPNGGHLNSSAGYGKFRLLLEQIKKII